MTVEVPLAAQQVFQQRSVTQVDPFQQWHMQQFFQQTINSLQLRSNFGLEELENIVGRVGYMGDKLQRADALFHDIREQAGEEFEEAESRLLRLEGGIGSSSDRGAAGSGRDPDMPATLQDLQELRTETLRSAFGYMRESLEMSRRMLELSSMNTNATVYVQFTSQVSSSLRESVRRLTDGT